jgi:hypothetical protein
MMDVVSLFIPFYTFRDFVFKWFGLHFFWWLCGPNRFNIWCQRVFRRRTMTDSKLIIKIRLHPTHGTPMMPASHARTHGKVTFYTSPPPFSLHCTHGDTASRSSSCCANSCLDTLTPRCRPAGPGTHSHHAREFPVLIDGAKAMTKLIVGVWIRALGELLEGGFGDMNGRSARHATAGCSPSHISHSLVSSRDRIRQAAYFAGFVGANDVPARAGTACMAAELHAAWDKWDFIFISLY